MICQDFGIISYRIRTSAPSQTSLANRLVPWYAKYKEPKEGFTMHLQESGEMYLETIYVLSQTNNAVRAIDVGEHLGYTKPSVSRAMGLLKSGGYVITNEFGHLQLTDAGRAIAEKIFERHTVLTEVLVNLGVPRAVASEDACKMEHVISDESFQAMKHHWQTHIAAK